MANYAIHYTFNNPLNLTIMSNLQSKPTTYLQNRVKLIKDSGFILTKTEDKTTKTNLSHNSLGCIATIKFTS